MRYGCDTYPVFGLAVPWVIGTSPMMTLPGGARRSCMRGKFDVAAAPHPHSIRTGRGDSSYPPPNAPGEGGVAVVEAGQGFEHEEAVVHGECAFEQTVP